MLRLGPLTAVVAHRGVRRFPTAYGELARGAAWFAAELVRREIRPGERVVLWAENSAAWIACFFGCVMRGVLVVPLDATGGLAFAQRVVRETSPRLIVGDALLLLSLPESREQMDLVQLEATMRLSAADPDLSALIADGLGPDTPLQILFTSGTTAEPKGIVHTHRNLLASLTPIEREIEKYRRYERFVHPLHFLHTLPLSHVFGQFMGLWVAPVLGAVVHYESRLETGRLLRLLRQERISVLAAVPRVLALLRAALLDEHPGLLAQLADTQQARIAKRWWRFRRIHRQLGYRFWAIVCGGATLPAELEGFWTTLGVALIQGYGMTETSALVTLNHPFKPARGTLGAPLPGRELRVSDQGELLVRGEMVATATWKDGALRENAAERDGWLPTGDLTSRDEQGRLRYLGRTGQRIVTSSGLNVYLEDVEAALTAQKGIDAAVALAIDGVQGPEPAAVLKAAQPALTAQAVAEANASLLPHQRIGRWWLWPDFDLPRTATGKIRRGIIDAWVQERLRDQAGARSGPDEHAAVVGQTAENARPDPLLRLIEDAIGGQLETFQQGNLAGREESSLESLGIDSLARVQLQAALERATGRSINDSEMASARTLGDLRVLSTGATETESKVASDPKCVSTQMASDEPGNEPNPRPPSMPIDLSSGGIEGKRLAEHSLENAKAAGPSGRTSFLFLRWPWGAPVRFLRVLFIELCLRPLVWLLAAPRVKRTDIPNLHADAALEKAANPPLLIVANHVSTYDMPLLLCALPRHLRWRVAVATQGEMLEDWRHGRGNPLGPFIYWLLTILFNVFPLPQSHDFRRAFLHAGQALDRGYSVLVFPEGARSYGGPVQPFRGGIGLLAQEAAVQVLPVALRQARAARTRNNLRPYTATISLGELVTVRPGEEAHAITARLEAAVRWLLDPSP